MYGTLAATWYLAPGSKSASLRPAGGAMPWYFRRSSHHAWLYFSGGISPEKTFQRHWSITSPKGRKAIFSSAWCSSRPMSLEVSGRLVEQPELHQVLGRDGERDGVADGLVEAVVGAVAERGRLLVVGALVEIVAQLVVDGEEILAGDLDAHLQAHVVERVDVPGAGVAHHLAVARLEEQRALPEGLRAAGRIRAR